MSYSSCRLEYSSHHNYQKYVNTPNLTQDPLSILSINPQTPGFFFKSINSPSLRVFTDVSVKFEIHLRFFRRSDIF